MARKTKKLKRSYIIELAARCLEDDDHNPLLVRDLREIARQFEIIEGAAARFNKQQSENALSDLKQT